MKIEKNELDLAIPNNRKIKLDSLNEKEMERYILIYNVYRNLFTKFICNKLELKKYDDKIKESALNFIENKKETMDMYQLFSSDILKYFYIRNNIYIEQLNEEEMKFFLEKSNDSNLKFDEETNKMINSTWEKVIFEDALKNEKKCIVSFGPDNSRFFAQNNSLVIGFRYDKFAKTDLNDEEWKKLYFEQLKYVNMVINEMEENLKNIISVPIRVIEYNEFCIKM